MSKSSIPKRPLRASLLGVLATLVIISSSLAASSANYSINFSQIGAGGAEGATSSNYLLSTTIGQAVAGNGTSSNYVAQIGYRQGFGQITPAPTHTPGGPTDTPVPTDTPAPTHTPGGPTDTPHPTDTPGGATSTPAPTNTPHPIASPTVTPGGPTPTDCPNPFVDTTGDIFYPAIHYLYCRGVVNGTDATHFSPHGTSTRGQFAKVVVLGFGLSLYTPPSGPDFTDVPSSYFAYAFIETGYHNGVLSGFDPGTCTSHGHVYPCYLPNLPITRGQLTKLVVNAAHYPLFTPTGGNPTFSDVPPSNVFFVSIETAHNKGIINGYPGGIFLPNQNIQRDQMCQIVYKGVTTP